jgi:hypothetical protein
MRYLLILLIFIPVSSFADTYPVIEIWARGYNASTGFDYSTHTEVCDSWIPLTPNAVTAEPASSSQCLMLNSQGGSLGIKDVTKHKTCPGGGTVSESYCINAPACASGETRISGVCTAPASLPFCSGSQNPVANDCRYNPDQVTVDCTNGSTVIPPATCPASTWQDVFPAPKNMCGPLDTDHTTCQPLLFQRMDDWASSHAILLGSALLALGAPIIGAGLAVLDSASILYADYTVLSQTADGTMIDAVVKAEVPTATFGDAVQKLIEFNPNEPYVSGLPTAINGGSAPNAPQVLRDVDTGHLRYSDSTIPLSNNQVANIAKALDATYPIPRAQVSTYLEPENIPWLRVAEPAIRYDLQHLETPNYFALEPVATSPVSVTTPQIIRSPSPFVSYQTSTGEPQPAYLFPSEELVRQRTPFVTFSPASPLVYPAPPAPSASSQPAPTTNQNPDGTDVATSPNTPPSPDVPIDPNISFLPPVPPTIYPDTYKYFPFLPTVNPFAWDVKKWLPQLPVTSCYYEIHKTFNVPFLGVKNFDFAPCVPLEPLRQVLQWAFAVLTAWSCLHILMRSSF